MAQCSPEVLLRYRLQDTMTRPHAKRLYHLVWTCSGSSEITQMLRGLEDCKQHDASKEEWKKRRKEQLVTDESLLRQSLQIFAQMC